MVRKLALRGSPSRIAAPTPRDIEMCEVYLHAGGRWTVTPSGRVEYLGEQEDDHKMVHLKYWNMKKHGFVDLFHVATKMNLRTGVPTVAWYEYPQEEGSDDDIPDIVALTSNASMELMYWHLNHLGVREVAIYLQDRDEIMNGDVIEYKLPIGIPPVNGRMYTNRFLWDSVTYKLNVEEAMTPEERQEMVDKFETWRIV